jgi:hypothetical protein
MLLNRVCVVGLPHGLVFLPTTPKVPASSARAFVLQLSPGTPSPFQTVLRLPDFHFQLYYIAIVSVVVLWSGELLTRMQVTNVVIRFVWVIYIPQSGPNFVLRSFIAAALEMLRRWQWNICGFRSRLHAYSLLIGLSCRSSRERASR